MFTGIIAEIGKIEKFSQTADGAKIEISASRLIKNLKKGGSISVEGLCLTATQVTPKKFSADLSPETLLASNAKFFSVGQKVNLELPVAAGEPLGGHLVTGHVDDTGQIIKIEKKGAYLKISFQINPVLNQFIMAKGSVAVDGISLTIAETGPNNFSVMLIPETIKNTTLAAKRLGALVNIETDLLLKQRGKNDLKETKKGLTFETLEKSGFI